MIQFFTKKLNNNKGFTLIELLIVLAVMALIATIAFPAFTGLMEGFRFKADTQTAGSIARQYQSRIITGIEKSKDVALTDVTSASFGEAPPSSKLDGTFKYSIDAAADAKSGTITVILDRDGSAAGHDSDDPITTLSYQIVE